MWNLLALLICGPPGILQQGFQIIPVSVQPNCRLVPSNRPRLPLSKSVSIHHSWSSQSILLLTTSVVKNLRISLRMHAIRSRELSPDYCPLYRDVRCSIRELQIVAFRRFLQKMSHTFILWCSYVIAVDNLIWSIRNISGINTKIMYAYVGLLYY